MLTICYPLNRIIQVFLLCFSIIACSSLTVNEKAAPAFILLKAARVFDGQNMLTDTSVLIKDNVIESIGPQGRSILTHPNTKILDLGNATLLPGLIELHAHLSYKNIPPEVVLKHGITTIRDVGGPVHKPYGGDGNLRILTSGPNITAPGGYPISVMGSKNIAIAVDTEQKARETVKMLIDKGAVVIKIALEPGGEPGAPWSSGHHKSNHGSHHHSHQNQKNTKWPLLSENIVKAIVNEAHKYNRKVTAHIGEVRGAEIAINAGVDEWAHIPCDFIPKKWLKKAVEQQVKVVTTIDTLSKCSGIMHNTKILASLGADFLYGAEIAHQDIPWGIDSQELLYLMQLGKMSAIDVLKTATSKAGQHLNLPLLGTLQTGAPADMIAIKGSSLDNFKNLEYPGFVMSGGKVVVNTFVEK